MGARAEGEQAQHSGQDVHDVVPAVHVEDAEYGVRTDSSLVNEAL